MQGRNVVILMKTKQKVKEIEIDDSLLSKNYVSIIERTGNKS
jgi:DNA-binding protein YbaB